MKSMNLLHATWATHEAFRRLGIDAGDLFVIPSAGPKKDQVFVRARQGAKEFNFHVGKRSHGETSRDFAAKWEAFVMGLGTMPEEELQAIWSSWLDLVDRVGFVSALLLRGFRLKSSHLVN